MRTTSLVLVAAIAAGTAAWTLQSSAGAQEAKTRVIDRTLICVTGVDGGARVIHVSAKSAYRAGGRLEWLGQALVDTPGQPLPQKPYYRPTLAGVTAGWPPPRGIESGGLGFENKLCTATRSPVPFSRRGLIGGAASQLGDEHTCIVQRTLLVRVRAVFRQPTLVKAIDKRSYTAIGRIEKGQLSVRTLTGKPLVYAEVADSGRARAFTTGNCS